MEDIIRSAPTLRATDGMMRTMLLSSTPQGKAWLAQLDTEDQDLAAFFLNGLRLISCDAIENSIHRQLESLQKETKSAVALYAVREIVRNELYFPADKKDRPTHIPRNQQAGSEGRTAHLIRSISGKEKDKTFYDHPSLDTLKRNKIRTIAIVDDISYTGNRIASFINGFINNKTILSWVSGRAVELVVVTCASTKTTEATLRKRLVRTKRGNFKVWPRLMVGESLSKSSIVQTFKSIAPQISTLMKKYGVRGRISPKYHCGYGSTMATIIPAYRCPNNAPGILWSRTKKWSPLFPDRGIPSALRHFFTAEIDERPSLLKLLAASPTLMVHFATSGAARRVKLLSLLQQGHRKIFTLAAKCEISHSYVRSLLARMRDEGLVDARLNLESSGLDILKKFQGHGTLSTDALRESHQRLHLQEFYFPRTLKTTRRVL